MSDESSRSNRKRRRTSSVTRGVNVDGSTMQQALHSLREATRVMDRCLQYSREHAGHAERYHHTQRRPKRSRSRRPHRSHQVSPDTITHRRDSPGQHRRQTRGASSHRNKTEKDSRPKRRRERSWARSASPTVPKNPSADLT